MVEEEIKQAANEVEEMEEIVTVHPMVNEEDHLTDPPGGHPMDHEMGLQTDLRMGPRLDHLMAQGMALRMVRLQAVLAMADHLPTFNLADRIILNNFNLGEVDSEGDVAARHNQQLIRTHRCMSSRGMTLLEMLLALALTVVMLTLIGQALYFHLYTFQSRRDGVEQSQLARALLQHIANDLRAAVATEAVDNKRIEGVSLVGSDKTGTNGRCKPTQRCFKFRKSKWQQQLCKQPSE